MHSVKSKLRVTGVIGRTLAGTFAVAACHGQPDRRACLNRGAG
jgi:hypothetical protein